MIEFIYIHRGTVLTVPHGILICKSSDHFSVTVDEWLNDGEEGTQPTEKRYTMYELQMFAEKLDGRKVFYVWE